MRESFKFGIVIILLGVIGFACARMAAADTGSGSAVVTAPADQLADPLKEPGEAISDLKSAKRDGWAIAVLAGAVMAARLLGRLGGRFKKLSEGKVALVIGAVTAMLVSAYNALALGGSWGAVAMAAIVAGAAAWDAAGKSEPKPVSA